MDYYNHATALMLLAEGRTQMKTMQKNKLHFIGVYRGVSQYAVSDDPSAVVLEVCDKYFLSHASNTSGAEYDANIIRRIITFYAERGFAALGAEIEMQ